MHASCGSTSIDTIRGGDDVRAGLPVDVHDHGRLVVHVADVAQVFHRILDARDVGKPDGGPVAIGDDQGTHIRPPSAIDPWCGCSTFGHHPRSAPSASWRSRRSSTARTSSRPRPRLFSLLGSIFNPHAGQRAAAYEHLAHAFHLRDALLDNCRRLVVNLAGSQRAGGEPEHDNQANPPDSPCANKDCAADWRAVVRAPR